MHFDSLIEASHLDSSGSPVSTHRHCERVVHHEKGMTAFQLDPGAPLDALRPKARIAMVHPGIDVTLIGAQTLLVQLF